MFAENFQNRAPDVAAVHFQPRLSVSNTRMRHDEASSCFLSWMIAANSLPERIRGWREEIWRSLLTASFGHHGTPYALLGPDKGIAELRHVMYDNSREDARSFLNGVQPSSFRDIYVSCGLDRELAVQVSRQLMAHDALGAHTRDDIGISETLAAPPLRLGHSRRVRVARSSSKAQCAF